MLTLYRSQGVNIIYFVRENLISRILTIKHTYLELNFILLLFLFTIILGWCCSNINYYYLTTLFAIKNEKLHDLRLSSNMNIQIEKCKVLIELVENLDSSKIYSVNKSKYGEMLNRIVLLSSGSKIYSDYKLERDEYYIGSNVRKKLLLALVKTKIDSFSFKKIKKNMVFYGVDLSNNNLQFLNLDGIDLRYANLSCTNMVRINLDSANLNGANISRANLDRVSLVEANLISSNLNGVCINEVNLKGAKLDSSNLSYININNSNLENSSFIQSNLNNSMLYNSNLSSCLFMSTNLINAVFTNSTLYNIDIYNSSLGSALFENVVVKNNLKGQLFEKNNVGLDTLFSKYIIICELSSFSDSILCRFKINER